MKKVLVFGTFDLLHKGHKFVFRTAKQFGQLYVVVARDTTVKKHKKIKKSEVVVDCLLVTKITSEDVFELNKKPTEIYVKNLFEEKRLE